MSYTSITGLPQKTAKYQCLMSGEKRLTPCSVCSNPSRCIAKTMHYKESTNMADTTPIVKLLADGGIECAKGLELKDCGYKPGAKVCGKCGAKAVTQTEEAVPADAAPEVAAEKSEWVTASDEKVAKMAHEETEMAEDEEMPAPKKKKKPAMPMVAEEEETDDEDEDMPEDLDEDEEKMYGEIEKMMEQRKKARAKRMETMGVKSADYDDLAFVCAIERRVYAGGSQICASCPGGCEQQDTMPSLLEVEGMAESMFAGKVLDSGYADEVDIFVVDVQRKDGKPVEAYFDGTSGECMGWHLLNEDLIGEVATVPGQKVISFSEASAIATKSIDGEVVSVDADMFDGYDAYAVEIEGVDGKSYDVYVGVDGEILGFDEYEPEEASDIDEEVADIALKAMYSEDERMEMAKGGMAMADGSYPIKDEEDLKMAIMAVGRAKDQDEAKMHCMKRAKELGKEDMIPDSWNTEKPNEKVLLDDEAKEFLSSLMELEMLEIETGFDK
jgi:uncharacterized membrane protein YkoI